MSVDEIKKALKEANRLMKNLQALQKAKITDASDVNKIKARLNKLPAGEKYGAAIEDWKSKTLQVIDNYEDERKKSFNQWIAKFIRGKKELGIKVREFQNSWRVGQLEVELNPKKLEARCRYNREVVVPWFPLSTEDSLEEKYQEAVDLLKKCTLPLNKLADLFLDAHKYAIWQLGSDNMFSPEKVPATKFYDAVRLSFIKQNLKPRASKVSDLPKWVFLYNLDLYFENISRVPKEKRLRTEAGSQREVSKGLAIIVKGLNPEVDYRKICYIVK